MAIHEFLVAARDALAAGRSGEAQEPLERAEARALDRSVPYLQTATPINNPLAQHIEQVLHTLGDGDQPRAMRLLDQVIAEAPR